MDCKDNSSHYIGDEVRWNRVQAEGGLRWKLFPLFTKLQTPDMFFPHQSMFQLTRHYVLSSVLPLSYLELTQTPQVKGLNPRRLPPT